MIDIANTTTERIILNVPNSKSLTNVSKKSNCSLASGHRIMKKLEENDIIKFNKINGKIYVIPELTQKGKNVREKLLEIKSILGFSEIPGSWKVKK